MRIQLRRDTSANLTNVNPVLFPGELAYDTTKKLLKAGNGSTQWNSIRAAVVANSDVSETVTTAGTQTLTNKTFTGTSIQSVSTSSLDTSLNVTTLNLSRANVITLNAGTVLANVGAGFQNMEVLTTVGTGTWTLPAALLKIGAKFKVTAVGGGGSGAAEGQADDVAGGGGSGAVVIGFYTVNNLANTSMSYGVGAAGPASIKNQTPVDGGPSNTTYNGITFSAGGGISCVENDVNGGAGGTATGGTFNLNGFRGHKGTQSVSATNPTMGKGADTPLGFGQGGGPNGLDSQQDGLAGEGYGAGGSGAYSTGAERNGGAGTQGIIIIEY